MKKKNVGRGSHIKQIIILFVSIFLMGTMSACGNSKNVEQDLIKTLDELKNGVTNEESYIYNSSLSASESIPNSNDDINKKIASLVEYSISEITVRGEEADASIKLTSPDIYVLLTEIASDMQENDVEQLLEQLNDSLDENILTKKYEITVNLKLVNEHWYLVPSGELANAFSGGIIEQYSAMGLNVIDGFLEEENND